MKFTHVVQGSQQLVLNSSQHLLVSWSLLPKVCMTHRFLLVRVGCTAAANHLGTQRASSLFITAYTTKWLVPLTRGYVPIGTPSSCKPNSVAEFHGPLKRTGDYMYRTVVTISSGLYNSGILTKAHQQYYLWDPVVYNSSVVKTIFYVKLV